MFAGAGIGQVILKLGGANNGVYHSSDHLAKVAAVRAAGLTVGHYWFNGRAGGVASQVATIMGAEIGPDELLWWDVESEGSMPHWSPAEVVEYATALNAAGIPFARQGIYLSSSVTRAVDWSPVVALGLRLWVADYGVNNGQPSSVPLVGYWPAVALWQYTSTGKLPGYDGNLDLNKSGEGVWTVHRLQEALGVAADGRYGPATTEAVRAYQKANGLFPDGIAGTKTLTSLGTTR